MINFGENAIKKERKKSIMQPFYKIGEWKTEVAFIEFLEKSEAVDWWFKNRDREVKFFAVPYINKEWKPFYVDFIVKLKNGRVDLFDTKAGYTQKIAGSKIDGLHKYIQAENKKGKKLFGGIVVNTDRNYPGRWIHFDKLSKNLKDNDFSNWIDLIL